MDDDVVPQNAHLRIPGDLAVLDHTAGNGADGADLVGHAHLRVADDNFLELGREHTLHGGLDLVDGVVDHAVEPHIHIGAVGAGSSGGVGTDIEAHHNGACGGGKQNVAFVDGADARVDDTDADFLVGDLLQRGFQRFGGALHVGLDDQRQLLHFALLHLGEQIVQGDLLVHLGQGVLLRLTALLHQLTGHTLVGDGVELVARRGHVGKAGDLHRHGGAGGLDGASFVVGHNTDTADGGTGDDDIALLQRAVLHQQRRHGTPGLIQPRFDHHALGAAVGVGLQLQHLGGEDDHFQQIVQTLTGLGGDGADDGLAAPLLGDQVVLGQLLLDLVGVGGGLIHLIDGDDNGNVRSLGVVDGLDGLGHDAVVGGNHQNGDIRGLRAAGTHGGKGRVAGGIQKRDHIPVHVHSVSADVLGDAAGFFRSDGGLADGVQQGGLAVVNVTHDHYDGGAGLQLFGGIHMVVDDLLLDGDGDFLLHLAAHLGGHELGGVKIDGLVDGGHDAVLHQALDDLSGGLLHPGSQLAHGDLLGNLHRQRCLPGDLHLQAAHFLLLLVPGLAAAELAGLLLIALLTLLAADALLAALIILHLLGDQIVHVGKASGVDLHGGGVHHPALPLPFRLLGLVCLGRLRAGRGGLLGTVLILGLGLRLRLLGLRGLLGFLLGSLGLGGFGLGRLRLRRGLHGKHLLQRRDLVGLGHAVKHQIQFLIGEHLRIGLGLLKILGDDVRDHLRRNAEVCRDLLQTILH